jgi:predicted secreted hydrolase
VGRTVLLVLLLLAAPPRADEGFRRADAPRAWRFPADHGSHPSFQTEWWYFTGALADTAGGRFGYELTFFRFALAEETPAEASAWRARDLILAHLAVTDVGARRFHMDEAVQRAAVGLAGADEDSLHVWLGSWRAVQRGAGFSLRAEGAEIGLDLVLRPRGAPVLHGEAGLSWKSADRDHASYYYSLPRLATVGTISVEGRAHRVEGTTWMDHEFFSGAGTPVQGLGWDWFSCRLDDGRDLMLYLLRHPDGERYRAGTLVEADGSSRALDTSDLTATPTRWWTSPDTGRRYPVAWRLDAAAEDLALEVEALLDGQEIHAEATVGFAYWEGLCSYRGRVGGRRAAGEGYVELTGY